MKFKPCQMDAVTPCVNRGEICLRTAAERREYNKALEGMSDMLNDLKLPEVDCEIPAPMKNFCTESEDE